MTAIFLRVSLLISYFGDCCSQPDRRQITAVCEGKNLGEKTMPMGYFFFLLIINLCACTCAGNFFDQQKNLHMEMNNSLNNKLELTKKIIDQSVNIIQEGYRETENCKRRRQDNEKLSSVYLSKFAKRGDVLDCILNTTDKLETYWDNILKNHKYFVWAYVYDDHTKMFRIAPKTNTYDVFGPDRDFSNFNFFKIAKENYPNSIWWGVKQDASGSGRILIHSKGIKLKDWPKMITTSIDIKTEFLLNEYYQSIYGLTKNNMIFDYFIYGYYKKDNLRSLAFAYSTNESDWLKIQPKKNALFNVSNFQLDDLIEFESNILSKRDKIHSKDFNIGDNAYFCTGSVTNEINIVTLFCSKR